MLHTVKLVLTLALGFIVAGCQSGECTKCAPGTRPSNPQEYCSACIPVDGGVLDGAHD
jgi:hypothetical protein